MTAPYQVNDQGTSGAQTGTGSAQTIGSITLPGSASGDYTFSIDVKFFGRSDVPASLFADRTVRGTFDGTNATVTSTKTPVTDDGLAGYSLAFAGNGNLVEIQVIAPNGEGYDLDWVAWGGVAQ